MNNAISNNKAVPSAPMEYVLTSSKPFIQDNQVCSTDKTNGLCEVSLQPWFLYIPEVEIRFLICPDKPARQFEFWLDISRIWLDKFSGPIMIIIIMKGTKVLTFSASNLERMTHDCVSTYNYI